MASYYKKIDGKDYDKAILDMAKSSVTGQGDGRISLGDAKKIVKLIQDGGRITDVEKRSLQYILKKYQFTDTATEYIKQALVKTGAAKETKPVKAKAAALKKSPVVKKAGASAGIIPSAETKVKPVEKPEEPAKEKKSLWKCLIILLLLLLLTLGIYYLYSKYKNRTSQPGELNTAIQPADETKAAELQKAAEEIKPALQQKIAEETKPVKGAAGKTQYVIKENDTLVKISVAHYNDYRKWELIWKHNKGVLKSPVLIFPGQVIELPEDR